MQDDRNVKVLRHILEYCKEIQHTMDTFGRIVGNLGTRYSCIK